MRAALSSSLIALGMLLPHEAPAQRLDPASGALIRVAYRSRRPQGEGESSIRTDYQVGRLISARGDSIEIEFGVPKGLPEVAPARARVTVPRIDVETYEGHRPFGTVKGAGLGLAVGCLTGLAAGFLLPAKPGSVFASTRAAHATFLSLLGVFVGPPVGAAVGASTPVEVWTPIVGPGTPPDRIQR